MHARRGLAGRTSKQLADGCSWREEFIWWRITGNKSIRLYNRCWMKTRESDSVCAQTTFTISPQNSISVILAPHLGCLQAECREGPLIL